MNQGVCHHGDGAGRRARLPLAVDSRAGDISRRPANSALIVQTGPGGRNGRAAHPSRAQRRRARALKGSRRLHGERVRRAPGPGTPEALGRGNGCHSDLGTWHPDPEMAGRGSECPDDAERPGTKPRVMVRATEQWGSQSRRARESSWVAPPEQEGDRLV